MNGGRCGRVASHHQGLDVVMLKQVFGNGEAALAHEQVTLFPIRRMTTVGPIHKMFGGQGVLQGLQDTQAANATVKNTDRGVIHESIQRGLHMPPL